MSKDELPPDTAFWSLTIYDLKDGSSTLMTARKYSLCENSGFRLNACGGIEIYVSATTPSARVLYVLEGAGDWNGKRGDRVPRSKKSE